MPILVEEPSVYPSNLLDEQCEPCGQRVWWAVYTKARQEKALARQLVQYEVPFYLPLVAKDSLSRGRRVRSFVPLFNGYVFLFGSEEERIRSLTTNRISRILPVDNQAELQRDLRQVRTLIVTDAPLTIERRLTPGTRVRIKAGVMMGLEGDVLTRRGMTRLLVAVNFLQQGVSIEIDDFLLEPIC